MADRAQSEALGFALVFALMIASIGVVYTGGFSALEDMRDVERVENAQRAFEVLSDNFEDITHRGAPSRATEIKLADARLFLDEPITVNVSVEGTSFDNSYDVRPIVYAAGTGEKVVFEQGAVIRQSGGGENSVVVHEANVLMDENATAIPVLQTRLAGTGGVAGSTTVLVRADRSNIRLVYSNETGNTVWLNVTSPRASGWRDYLDDKPDVSCEPVENDEAACRVQTDRVYVTLVQIDIALD